MSTITVIIILAIIIYFFAAKINMCLVMAGFDINMVRWVILKLIEIFHCQFRTDIALFDTQYFNRICNTV